MGDINYVMQRGEGRGRLLHFKRYGMSTLCRGSGIRKRSKWHKVIENGIGYSYIFVSALANLKKTYLSDLQLPKSKVRIPIFESADF